MEISPRWSALVVVFAILYGSMDHFRITKHFDSMLLPKTSKAALDFEKRQLATGFLQASSISVRPVAGAGNVGTHIVTLAVDDLSPLTPLTVPASSGVVHIMASTRQFLQVGFPRTPKTRLSRPNMQSRLQQYACLTLRRCFRKGGRCLVHPPQ